jgi:Ribonuclease G/E
MEIVYETTKITLCSPCFNERPGINMDSEEIRESLDYLEETLTELEKLVKNIGKNGPTASLLCNYRDEVQDTIEELRGQDVDLTRYFQKLVVLDNHLRQNAKAFVNEIGHQNFKQYQIVNDPPRDHWWWYLNRTTSPPPPERKDWKFWKKK